MLEINNDSVNLTNYIHVRWLGKRHHDTLGGQSSCY